MGLKAAAWLVAANRIIAYMIIVVNMLLQKIFAPARQADLSFSFATASKKAITAQATADVIIALIRLILYKVFAEIYLYLFVVYAYLLIFDPRRVKHSFR